MSPSDDVLLDIHRRMRRIRAFELEAGELMESGRVPGSVHLYVGQEAVAAGVCANLRDDDQITSTHRGHGHMVAKGGAFAPMIAEALLTATGNSWTIGVYIAVAALVSLAAVSVVKETKGTDLHV